ncbi:ABC transporter permease [Sediminispirochaeta smaragdinae]|uniref:Binding-protein-dependent transport systems inner membrane component n=1 Tax=Sediminispirochaeta smaragdinae (strain DSM 11293 / JCM 15392 / SEBR 4228) TaxID=573413 RepID=E1R146_SEDSS|nr:ABC transporter permease [Sediminispirochaeta smaragdinae]ADK80295.1 binding-protein-dependent transport systems inner membrane component [Sediminispirochaeta smaragdinae DSM 11293]
MIKDMLKLFIENRKALAGVIILGLFILMALLAPLLAPYGPKQDSDEQGRFPLMAAPCDAHPLGTTNAGYDILSQLIYGSRVTLTVGILTGLLTSFISLAVGLFSGYLKGAADDVISFITNIFLVIPSLPLVIVVASYVPMRGVVPIIVVLSLTGWAWGARVVRAQVMSVGEREFVKVAEVMGENSLVIVFREILPNIISLVMAIFFTSTIAAIIGEATLEFIGLGNVSTVTWGTMLFWAQNNAALLMNAWWWFLPPGLGIGLLGTSFALMNFAIDEISNPKIRKR